MIDIGPALALSRVPDEKRRRRVLALATAVDASGAAPTAPAWVVLGVTLIGLLVAL